MVELVSSSVYDKWIATLRDRKAVTVIAGRLIRLAAGNPGEVRPVGDGVSELIINFGPGYRVYYKQIGPLFIVLLIGGDKATQREDITRAKVIAANWSS